MSSDREDDFANAAHSIWCENCSQTTRAALNFVFILFFSRLLSSSFSLSFPLLDLVRSPITRRFGGIAQTSERMGTGCRACPRPSDAETRRTGDKRSDLLLNIRCARVISVIDQISGIVLQSYLMGTVDCGKRCGVVASSTLRLSQSWA